MLYFLILAFSINFCPIKIDMSVTLFDLKLQVFKNSTKWTIFGIFNQFLSTQNINVARFETFSVIFKHPTLFLGQV